MTNRPGSGGGPGRPGDAMARDLSVLGRLDARDERFRDELRERLLVRAHGVSVEPQENRTIPMATTSLSTTSLYSRPRRRAGHLYAQLAAVAAVLALTLGGAAVYLSVQRPQPASARTILRQAAIHLLVAPDQVVHETGTMYYGQGSSFGTGQQEFATGPITLTVDQWTQFDTGGAIGRQVSAARTITGALVFTILQIGQQVRVYGARSNAIETASLYKGERISSWADGSLGITDPRRFVLAARNGSLPHVRLLQGQKLDGAPVDIVERIDTVAGPAASSRVRGALARQVYRVYIDARTYAIRGADSVDVDTQGNALVVSRMRATRRDTVPLARVPAGTFALKAPASAHMLTPLYDRLSVAQAVARPGEPVPLLSGGPGGLRLRQVIFTHLTQPPNRPLVSIDYDYLAGTPEYGPFAGKNFAVAVILKAPAGAYGLPAGATSRTLALTVADAPVRAAYGESPAGSQGTQRTLTYKQGMVTVRIEAMGMRRAEFFDAVRALVDGHTHPAVAARLQRDLDTPATSG